MSTPTLWSDDLIIKDSDLIAESNDSIVAPKTSKQSQTKRDTANARAPIKAPSEKAPQIFRARQHLTNTQWKLKREAYAELKEAQQAFLVKTAAIKRQYEQDALAKRLAKEAATKHYFEREAQRKDNAKLTSNSHEMTLNQRVFLNAKYHSCPCNLAFNGIKRLPDGYKFTCDHATQIEYDPNPHTYKFSRCNACGIVNLNYFLAPCGCISGRCLRCKRSTYIYDHVSQYYDKHSVESRALVYTLGREDYTENNFNLPAPFKPKASRKTFLQSLKTVAAGTSYADALKTDHSSKIKDVETKDQGAAMSAAVAPLSTGASSIKKQIIDIKIALKKRLEELIKVIRAMPAMASVATIIDSFLKAARYAISTICDYIVVLNPILLFRLWDNRHSKARLFFYVVEAMAQLSEFEHASAQNIKLQIALNGFPHLRRLVRQKKVEHVGVLNTAFRHIMLSNRSDYDAMVAISHLGVLTFDAPADFKYTAKGMMKQSLQTIVNGEETVPVNGAPEDDEDNSSKVKDFFKNLKGKLSKDPPKQVRFQAGEQPKVTIGGPSVKEVDTKNQAEDTGFSFLMDMLKHMPRKFAAGAKILTALFKEYMPLLMGVKVLLDLEKYAERIISSLVGLFYTQSKNPRDWIDLQISTTGNPIHDVVTTYVVYMSSVSASTIPEVNLQKLRSEFYVQLAEADKYVTSEKKFTTAWIDFRGKLTNSFSVPPKASEREFEPTCLVLSGPPGTGKSTIWKIIVGSQFTPPEGVDHMDHITNITYTWNSASEFQPGMTNGDIILFDDFGQNTQDNIEALSLIALCTVAPYPVNSPSITGPEIKGTFATPEAVVVCTNLSANRAAANIADPVALLRRFDIQFVVEKQFDPTKPDEPILVIAACSAYKGLIGTKVSLPVARVIFATVHTAKRKRFAETRSMVVDEISKDLIGKIDFAQWDGAAPAQGQWLKDGDFMRDYEALIKNVDTKNQGLLDFLSDHGYHAMRYSVSMLLTGAVLSIPAVVGYGYAAAINVLAEAGVSFCTRNEPFVVTLKKIFRSTLKCLFVSMAAAAGAFTLYHLIFTSDDQSGSTKTAKAKSPTVQTFNQGASPDLDLIFRNATGSLHCTTSEMMLNCVFIGGHYILAPLHIFETADGVQLKDGAEFNIHKSTWNGVHKTFLFESKNMTRLHGAAGPAGDPYLREDIALYRLPASKFSAEKRITHHFWDGDYDTTNFPVERIDYRAWKKTGEYEGTSGTSSGTVTHNCCRTFRMEGYVQKYQYLAEATYAAADGSCGSLVIRSDTCTKPILGIHTAHKNQISYFHFVTERCLNEAMSSVVVDVETKYVVTEPQAELVSIMPERSTLHFEGTSNITVFQPTKTDLKPSLLHSLMGPAMTGPSPLSCKDPRINEEYRDHNSFYRKLFKGYQATPGSFPPSELQAASQSLREDMVRIQKSSIVKTKKLTLGEALNGLPYIPANTRVEMGTSCGYPYAQQGITKKHLISEIDGQLYANPKLTADYEHAAALLEKGVVPCLPFALTLKDERIKLAKIDDPRTRVFACGNVVHFLLSRKYFYTALMQLYHANIHDAFCIPSLDRISFDWHRLSNKMLEVGTEGFDFDFTNYDRTLSHQLLYFSVKVLLAGQNLPPLEEAALIELICTPHMVWGTNVFRSCGGLMSGMLITYAINCIANEIMHRAAWTYIMSLAAPAFVEMRHYRAYTRGMRGGDDTITTVDPRILPVFNGRTVSDYLISRGMLVTSATKASEIEKSTPYCELSFLKNKTRYERGVYLPQPELASLYESTYWVRLNKDNHDMLKATQDNTICSLRGIFFHGEEIFDAYRNKALEREPRLQLPTYTELLVIWRAYLGFPGAHADYASRELQEDPFVLAARDVKVTNMTSIDSTPNYNMNYSKTVETTNQALDKQKLETSEKANASPIDTIGPVPTKSLLNQDNTIDKQEDTRVGATIQDAADNKLMPVMTGSITAESKNMRAEQYLNDVNWDLAKLAHKFTYIRDVVWTTADATNTLLATLQAPHDFIVTPAQKTPFDVTRYWKARGILVKLVIKASPFYAGSLVIGFTPFNVAPSLLRLINIGGMVQKISQSEGIELFIPFRYPVGFMDVTVGQTLGSFSIFVNSPLTTGAGNPNNISLAMYAAIEDSEFKLPEPIPAAAYSSNKFPVRVTYDQAEKTKAILCDINANVRDMPKVVLCGGEGIIAKPKISHFQDAPDDLLQMPKRWATVSRGSLKLNANSVTRVPFPYDTLVTAAAQGIDQAFALYRGSINLRFIMTSQTGYLNHNAIAFFVPDLNTNYLYGSAGTAGAHHFDCNNLGQFTIPWVKPIFVDYTSAISALRMPYTGGLLVDIISSAEDTVTLEIEASTGDDFHLGVYLGGPRQLTLATNPFIVPSTITQRDIDFQFSYPAGPVIIPSLTRQPKIVSTLNQSGMVQNIDRALENTLPLLENISELASLLDAHMLTDQPPPVMTRKIPFSIASDLPQYTERLLTLNHNGMSLPDKECFGVSTTETSIHNLLTNTKSLVRRLDWNAAANAGDALGSFYTGPEASNIDDGDIHAKIPAMFKYWTGSTIYIFDVIATELHRGQLLFVFNTAPEDIAYTDSTQTYFTTLDLSEGRATVAIQLPYLSPEPYKRVIEPGEPPSESTSTGLLKIFVQNPLRASTTVSSNVEIVVYKAFGEDFQLGLYGKPTIASIPPALRRPHSASGVRTLPIIKR